MTEGQYVYLLREREFVKTGELIYKIGKTKKEHYTRFNQYPNGSILLLHIKCNDCDCNEKDIIKLFKTKYKHKKEIGNEYFEGNFKEMMKDIFDIVIKINKIESITIENKNKEKKTIKKITDYLSILTVKKLGVLCNYYKESKSGNKDRLIQKLIEKKITIDEVEEIILTYKKYKYFEWCNSVEYHSLFSKIKNSSKCKICSNIYKCDVFMNIIDNPFYES